MAAVKTSLERIRKKLKESEEHDRNRLYQRIFRLGYDPNEVLSFFPPNKGPSRARLFIWLEYEEIKTEYPEIFITEIQYVCTMYPTVILRYLNYLLDEVGLMPINELVVYGKLILENNPQLKQEFIQLERKWRECQVNIS